MYLLLELLIHFSPLWSQEPSIILSRNTTYITSPLQSDKTPDYEAYLRERGRNGVTPDNNAAVLMWPHNLEPDDYEPMQKELGLKQMPSAQDALQPLDGELMRQRIIDRLHLDRDEADPKEIVWSATDHKWTRPQCPPLAEWVVSNKRPLDLLVEASRRPRFYSPSPSYLNKKPDLLINILLPGTQNIRDAARALGVRGMWHLGENRLNDAWADILAMHRLARLASQGQALVDQLVAVSISESACRGTLSLLSSERLPVQLARQIQRDLDQLPRVCDVAECMNTMERLSALDAAVYLKHHGILHGLSVLAEDVAAFGDEPKHKRGPNITKPIPFDANIVLRRLNSRYDRLVMIARLPRKARSEAYERFFIELENEGQRIKRPLRLVAAAISVNIRSEWIESIMANLLIPASEVANTAEDRAHTSLALTRLAAGLAVHHAEHRSYPKKLDDLMPAELKALPVDLDNSQPYIYKPTADGYLLYSVGSNGIDDGGSNSMMQIFEGQATESMGPTEGEAARSKIPGSADDFSIRLPIKPFEMPKTRTE